MMRTALKITNDILFDWRQGDPLPFWHIVTRDDYSALLAETGGFNQVMVLFQGKARWITIVPAEDSTKNEPLVDQVENVIKGVRSGKVPARQVDDLHDATTRAKQDRSVIRNINRG